MKPDYSIPLPVLIDLTTAILLRQHRRFPVDASRLRSMRGIPASVYGQEHIPSSGPGVITVNHYSSPTFWSLWIAVAVSAVIPVDVRWIMANAWTFPGQRFGHSKRWLSHLLLTSIARVYGFETMPPMPPAPSELAERAAAVQRLIRGVRAQQDVLIGFAPEGGDQSGGRLALPPEGVGKLGLALARHGMVFYPVGLYEDADGWPCLHFGVPYRLEINRQIHSAEIDLAARQQMMHAIAACVPENLRGQF